MSSFFKCRLRLCFVLIPVVAGCGGAEEPAMESSETADSATEPDSTWAEYKDDEEAVAADESDPDAGTVVGADRSEPDRGFTRERVYFATNRDRVSDSDDPNEYFISEQGAFRFGVCEVSIPHRRKPGSMPEPSLLKLEFREDPKKHIVLMKIEILNRSDVRTAVSDRVGRSPEKEVLVFIHGYKNTFRDAARRTAQLAYDLNFQGAAMFFSWPAGKTNYLADLRQAQEATDECVDFLRFVTGDCGAKKIHIIAHSMGNFVLTNALRKMVSNPTDAASFNKFHHIALAAPDISAKTFREDIAPQIQGLADRFTIYASKADLAMDVSRKANDWDPLGDVNRESTQAGALPFVDFIDATEISRKSWFSVGHAYYGDMPELIRDVRDLFHDVPTSSRRLTQSGSIFLLQP